MKFICFGDDLMPSKNDKDIHYITSVQTKRCFSDALHKLHVNTRDVECLRNCPENLKGRNFDDVITLYPRYDGNYSMVDEIFNQFIPQDKWASVAITGKDGKPFYIKDKWLRFQLIMRCESSIVGLGGNNRLLNKLILEESGYPDYMTNKNFKEESENWYKWWGAKPHILDLGIFNVELFSSSYINGPQSFVHPKTGKVGLLTNCRWTHEPIAGCREELEWVCNELCSEENNLEFYVSFFNEDINYGKYKKDYKDPEVTFKLSHKGIELVSVIPVKNMKWVFSCNKKLYGKEWKKFHFLWKLNKLFRKVQDKLFHDDYVLWHNYTLMGDCLNNIMNLSERYYTVDEIIRMIQIWKECYCD